jgi:hypothetical protein
VAALLIDLFAEWLMAGGRRPERAQLLFFFGTTIFGLLLSVILLIQNGSARIAIWPEGSYYGLMFATLTAIPGLPVGAVHFVRYKAERRLSATCAVTSCGTLLMSFWLFSR